MNSTAALRGINVWQGPGRYAVSVCGRLLAQLGADVVVRPEGEFARDADVQIASPQAMPKDDDVERIRCAVSAVGSIGHQYINSDAAEIDMQALGGLMSTSGHADGPPRVVEVPILEIFTGIDAAASILAALRIVELGGPPQSIDAALWDTNASLLGTFVAQVTAGKASGYRDGARHSICAPWNAYRCADGFAMICTSSDAQWQRLLRLMDREGLASDPRFIDMRARRANIAAVDELVRNWTTTMTVTEVVVLLKKSGIPAGVIASADTSAKDDGAAPFELSRTPLRLTPTMALSLTAKSRWRPARGGRADPPLNGVRVLEIGPFTAGPLTGRSLSDLGAEVVKIEPAGGEVSRAWSPRSGHVSGYFANYNTGKKSLVLDLNDEADRDAFEKLLSGADILVQNLKAGALEKLGFGAETVMARHPKLIYCSISGYGVKGAADAALDTVIQAESGIMSAVGDAEGPCKIGFSVADLIAGHLAVLGILAALRARSRDSRGQHVDISMLRALKWLVQEGRAYPARELLGRVRRGNNGDWLLAPAGAADQRELRVRDLGEVFADPSLWARKMLWDVACTGGENARVIGSPYPLNLTPPMPRAMIGSAGADRNHILKSWSDRASIDGEVA